MHRHILVRSTILNLGLGLLLTTQSTAQSPRRLGIVAGSNFAKIEGNDVAGADTRTAFVGGLNLVLPIAPSLSIVPELLYSMKGSTGQDDAGPATFRANYVEVPVLFRFDVQNSSGARPLFYAGPSIAFQTKCEFEGSDFSGAHVTMGCKDFFQTFGEGDVEVHKVDAGAVFGGGVAFNASGRVMTLGVRYELGIKKLFTGTDAKNRVLSLIGSLEFPILGK